MEPLPIQKIKCGQLLLTIIMSKLILMELNHGDKNLVANQLTSICQDTIVLLTLPPPDVLLHCNFFDQICIFWRSKNSFILLSVFIIKTTFV
jgi:hypothetical protein